MDVAPQPAWRASTSGTGELIALAVEQGADRETVERLSARLDVYAEELELTGVSLHLIVGRDDLTDARGRRLLASVREAGTPAAIAKAAEAIAHSHAVRSAD